MKARLNFKQQRGGASLLTTVILAVLLIGVVGGLTTLSVNELRQASNNEQTARALSAAQSGVSQLDQKITAETGSHDRPYCNGEPGDTQAQAVARGTIQIGDNSYITCATVKSGDSDVTEGVVERDQSYKIDLSKSYKVADGPGVHTPVAKMSIEWGKGGPGEVTGQPKYAPNTFPPLATSWDHAAALELSYVWWDNAITPLNSGVDNFGLPLEKLVVIPSHSLPVATNCSVTAPSGEAYACHTGSGAVTPFQLSTLPSQPSLPPGAATLGTSPNLVFKLTARYNKASFRLKFYDASGAVLTIPQPYAIIDVTAKSNNLYRRVIAQKLLDAQGSNIDYLDNVIFSGKNICKDMKVDVNNGRPTNSDGSFAGDGKNTAGCEN